MSTPYHLQPGRVDFLKDKLRRIANHLRFASALGPGDAADLLRYIEHLESK